MEEGIEISIGPDAALSLQQEKKGTKTKTSSVNVNVFILLSCICFSLSYEEYRQSQACSALLFSLLPNRVQALTETLNAKKGVKFSSLVCTCLGWLKNSATFAGEGTNVPAILHTNSFLPRLLLLHSLCREAKYDIKVHLRYDPGPKKVSRDCFYLFVEIMQDAKERFFVDLSECEIVSSLPKCGPSAFFLQIGSGLISCSKSSLGAFIKAKRALASVTRTATKFKVLLSDDFENNDDASDEIPTSKSKFTGHPKYVLESQLRKYEVLHPPEIAGFFGTESVYFKKHIRKLKSKEAWLTQFGKVIKPNEQPAKVVLLSSKTGKMQPLYGEWQVEDFTPPEALNGVVPRNDHGNVDLFTPAMLPKGCVRVNEPEAWKVAKLLGIDYADACMGFSFHGGRAVPELQGIVICAEHYDVFTQAYNSKISQIIAEAEQQALNKICALWESACDAVLIARKLKQSTMVSAMHTSADRISSSAPVASEQGASVFQPKPKDADQIDDAFLMFE